MRILYNDIKNDLLQLEQVYVEDHFQQDMEDDFLLSL